MSKKKKTIIAACIAAVLVVGGGIAAWLIFGGGSGASAKLEPVAFLIIRGESVKLLPVAPPPATTVDRVIEVVPEVVEKVTDFLEKQKKADEPPEGTDHFVV